MIGLLQRVTAAQVEIDGSCIARIGGGLLVFVGVERGDSRGHADRLLERLLGYRVFPDEDGKMNLSLRDTQGELLLAPQFTLAANTDTGMRPSFPPAAHTPLAAELFDYLVEQACREHVLVESGRFGANMQITLTNDGPVTFLLHVRSPSSTRLSGR